MERLAFVTENPPHPQMFCRFTREKVMFFDGKPIGGVGATALKRVGLRQVKFDPRLRTGASLLIFRKDRFLLVEVAFRCDKV